MLKNDYDSARIVSSIPAIVLLRQKFKPYHMQVNSVRGLLPFFLIPAIILSCLLAAQPSCAGIFAQHSSQAALLKDGKLHIFLIGTGDPEVEMQSVRRPSSLALLYKDQFMVFDAGEGAIQTMAALGLPYEQLDKAFITHWHSDHFAGLPQVINASWVHGRKMPFVVYGPYGAERIVKALNSAYELDTLFRASTMDGLLDPSLARGQAKEFVTDQEGLVVYESEDLKVSAFLVDHSPVVPAIGYVIACRGRKIVISGDTRVVSTLEQHCQGADVLISEAASHKLIEEEIERDTRAGRTGSVKFTRDVKKYHADTLELAQMAERAGVPNLILTHFVPAIGTTRDAIAEFTAGMSAFYKGRLWAANDGDHLIVDVDAGTLKLRYLPQEQARHQLIRY